MNQTHKLLLPSFNNTKIEFKLPTSRSNMLDMLGQTIIINTYYNHLIDYIKYPKKHDFFFNMCLVFCVGPCMGGFI